MEHFDRFEKQHPKKHPKNRKGLHGNAPGEFISSLVKPGNLSEALSKVIDSSSDLEWALNKSTSEAPPHQQLRNMLVLSQLTELVRKLNKVHSPETVELQGMNPKDYGFTYPVGIPKEVLKYIHDGKADEALDWMSEGPYHEVAMDALIMNCLSAISASLDKNSE